MGYHSNSSGCVNMPDTFFDKLAMLLSTDWFFPWWASIGLRIPRHEKHRIQHECREEVKAIVSSADTYWLASFEIARVERTMVRISGLLIRSVSKNSALSRKFVDLENFANGQSSEIYPDLIEVMMDLLISGDLSSDSHMDVNVSEHIINIWKEVGKNNIDYSKYCEESRGEWDIIISSLTPDLPCMTADFVSLELESRDRVANFWSYISSSLDAAAVISVIRWYEDVANDLTGARKLVPNWMR